MLAATVLNIDFGENFANGISTTDVATLAAPVMMMGVQGPNLANYTTATDMLEFRSLQNTVATYGINFDGNNTFGDVADYLALKTSVINIVQRIFAPFNVMVQEAQATDVTAFPMAYNMAGMAYVFAGGVAHNPGMMEDLVGNTRNRYGDASVLDTVGMNTNDETALVYADVLCQDSFAFPIDVAMADVIAREAARTFGLAQTLNNPARPNQTLENTSDAMVVDRRAGVLTYLQTIHMFSRYNLMVSGANTTANTRNSYDDLVSSVGAAANFPGYITGTGAFDVVKLAVSATPGMVDVTVTAYSDNTFANDKIIDVPPAAPLPTYTVDPTNGILIDLGRSDDQVIIDALIGPLLGAGKGIIVRGGQGASEVDVVGDGTIDGTFTPMDGTTTVPGLGATLTAQLTTSNGTDVTLEEGNTSGAVLASKFAKVTYLPPNTDDANLNTSIQQTSTNGIVLQINGQLVTNGTGVITDAIGLQVQNVTSVLVDTTASPGADTLLIGDGGFGVEGLQNFEFDAGMGSDTLTIQATDILLPVAGGDFVYDGGDGVDTIAVLGTNADIGVTLTDSLLTMAAGGSVTLKNLSGEVADLVGGGGNDTFSVNEWSGIGTIDGGSGDDSLVFGGGGGLDVITGHFVVTGGDGKDTLTLDDSASNALTNYDVTDTSVVDDPSTPQAFGGVDFDSTVDSIVLTGTTDNNIFYVTPNLNTTLRINGIDPPNGTLPPDGDTLIVDFTGTTGRKFSSNISPKGPGNGAWTFTDGHKAIVFTSIEFIQGAIPTFYGAGSEVGQGSKPLVKVYDATSNALIFSFYAYNPNYKGGVRLAVADVNGDGVPDVITAPGRGVVPGGQAGMVKVFDGAQLFTSAQASPQRFVPFIVSEAEQLTSFFPEGLNYRNGLYVAAGDLDGDNSIDIVTSRSLGSPLVRVLTNDGSGTAFNQAFAFAPTQPKKE